MYRLEDVFSSMLVGKVPAMWMAKSYHITEAPGRLCSDLLARLAFFQASESEVTGHLGFYFQVERTFWNDRLEVEGDRVAQSILD